MGLERRTPLTRTTPLRSGAPPRRGGRLAPVSAKRAAQRPARDEIRAQVFARDGHRCLLADQQGGVPSCLGRLTPHHLRKASQQGGYTLANLVTLCVRHNDWLETDVGARFARLAGLVVRHGVTLEDAWALLRVHGLVTYDSTGRPLP